MHDALVISEVNPTRFHYSFNPYDPVQLLISQTSLKNEKEFTNKVFLDRVELCYRLTSNKNKTLVLRDHTHSDYFRMRDINNITNFSSLIDILKVRFDLLSMLTVRQPLESYLSLHKFLKNIKTNLIVQDFDDYCARTILMIRHYKNLEVPIFKYEDFCATPHDVMQRMCEKLELKYNKNFDKEFSKYLMTGDSGRASAGKIREIRVLPSKVPLEIKDMAKKSRNYQTLSNLLDYND